MNHQKILTIYDFDDTLLRSELKDDIRLPMIAYQRFCDHFGIDEKTMTACKFLFKSNSDMHAFKIIMGDIQIESLSNNQKRAIRKFRECIERKNLLSVEPLGIKSLLELRQDITLQVVVENTENLSLTPLGEVVLAKASLEKPVYIITNGYSNVVVSILTRLSYNPDCFRVMGTMEFFEKGFDGKPDPGVLELFLNENGLARRQIVYVGDSQVDIDFASNCGQIPYIVEKDQKPLSVKFPNMDESMMRLLARCLTLSVPLIRPERELARETVRKSKDFGR
jgi:phosphoglycolate phosphatase-like HAD superfamily hydrolase